MCYSAGILGEDTNDVHLNVLLLEMFLVRGSDPEERNEGHQHEEHVQHFGALFPGRDLGGVGLGVEVVDPHVQPVTIVVNVELLQILELVLRVVLQVVHFDHVVFGGLGLVSVPVEGGKTGTLVRNEVLGVLIGSHTGTAGECLRLESHGSASHKSAHQHFVFLFIIKLL